MISIYFFGIIIYYSIFLYFIVISFQYHSIIILLHRNKYMPSLKNNLTYSKGNYNEEHLNQVFSHQRKRSLILTNNISVFEFKKRLRSQDIALNTLCT